MVSKTNISLVHPKEANEEVQKLYDHIKSITGRVAPAWRAMAHKPEYMRLAVEKFSLVHGETKLDLRSKLLVYLAISIINNCQACIYAFSERLKNLGITDEEFVELISVIDTALGMNTVVSAAGITPEHLQEAIQEAEEQD